MTPEHYNELITYLWQRAEEVGFDALIPHEGYKDLTALEITTLLPTPGHAILLLLQDVCERSQSPAPSPNEPVSDYLFDVIMAHFDAAQSHRAAIRRLWGDLWFHPTILPVVIPGFENLIRSWQKPLESGTPKDILLTLQFRWFIGTLFHTWLQDDTLDQSKTMAALDQGLKTL